MHQCVILLAYFKRANGDGHGIGLIMDARAQSKARSRGDAAGLISIMVGKSLLSKINGYCLKK